MIPELYLNIKNRSTSQSTTDYGTKLHIYGIHYSNIIIPKLLGFNIYYSNMIIPELCLGKNNRHYLCISIILELSTKVAKTTTLGVSKC